MSLTAGDLKANKLVTFPTYGNGDVTGTEFNNILYEIKKAQMYSNTGVVNVLEFESPNNGVISSTAVTTAISTLAGTGGTVLIPAGLTVNCLSTINVPFGVTLVGSFGFPYGLRTMFDRDSSLSVTQPLIKQIGNSCNFTGILFTGGGVGFKVEEPGGAELSDSAMMGCQFINSGMVLKKPQNYYIHNVCMDVYNDWHIQMYGAQHCHFTNITLYNGGNNGTGSVLIDQAADGMLSEGLDFSSNTIYYAQRDNDGNEGNTTAVGIRMRNCKAVNIGQCSFKALSSGIIVESGSERIKIHGNDFNTIIGNHIIFNNAGSCSSQIMNNSFGSFDDPYYPITYEMNGDADTPVIKTIGTNSKIQIIGNTIDTIRTKGIELSASTTKTIVDNLTTEGITTPVSDLNGTNIVETIVN